jgi:hypothetical protein
LAAVVVPVADARRRAGVKSAAVVAHCLPQWFQRLEPGGFLLGAVQTRLMLTLLSSDLDGFQFDDDFGAAAVSATSESEGAFLPSGGTTFFIPGTIDNGGGSVADTADILIDAISGVDWSGTLAELVFTGLAPGNTSIELANVTLLDSNFNSYRVPSEPV